MDDLTSDSHFFPQISPSHNNANLGECILSGQGTEQSIITAASRVLGSNFAFRSHAYDDTTVVSSSRNQGGSHVYNTLTQVLPTLSPQSAFFWDQLGRPFSHMLDLAGHPPTAQSAFLAFVYARVLGFMGPCEGAAGSEAGEKSVMMIDGSPVEFSWVIGTRPVLGREAGAAPARQVRFAIEPIDPRNGRSLCGSKVLDYLTSERGGLGVVRCEEGGMQWRKRTEAFLFGDETEEGLYVPAGTRFFVGFHFFPSGNLTLKTYHIPRARPPVVSMFKQHLTAGPALFVGDVDMSPITHLLHHLDPRMESSFNLIMQYFACLRDDRKPRFQLLSSDCCPREKNRLKIYCRTMEGTAWSDVKQSFTLGGQLSSPAVATALASLEELWNCLFPTAASSMDCDLGVLSAVDAQHDQDEENDPARPHAQHPAGGLLYYYELVPGMSGVFPKIYLPVRHYCENDLAISQALEKFYAQPGILPPQPEGWVSREVERTFNHRPLAEKSGIQTCVTFALKKDGWDITSYFSPECWV